MGSNAAQLQQQAHCLRVAALTAQQKQLIHRATPLLKYDVAQAHMLHAAIRAIGSCYTPGCLEAEHSLCSKGLMSYAASKLGWEEAHNEAAADSTRTV